MYNPGSANLKSVCRSFFTFMNVNLSLIVGCVFLLAGCQAPGRYPSFAPLTPRLEAAPFGGAKYLVCVNTSGQELHNVSGSVYLWNQASWEFPRRRQFTHHLYFSCLSWQAGQVIRGRHFASTMEEPISEAVSGVEIVGHCDEGPFRESWVNTDNELLQPLSRVR